ncbi:hypothetical protein SAMN05421780_103128 [Flexibacter flexilis DSM 6793]|uniref:Outer membrane protein beta-barrel domain-containing protein n=1 Tax=Flexibacter flexilis DSM 6793 TaxID=927664 RepID=A0A1I1GWY8_9BACT|nr:hypothetical protein [Flexibacter flexilis]SFC16349.1 hypothetical protein SAMN05421780_103128 [Flexibacter flexilis DSM 6793]
MRYFYLIIVLFVTAGQAPAQTTIRLEEKTKERKSTGVNYQSGLISMVSLGAYLPTGDLKMRFGQHGEAGLGVFYKTASGWLMGLDGSYMFGRKVKEDALYRLRTVDGFVISDNGSPVSIITQERGVKAPFVKIGKVFHKTYSSKANKNSGYVAQVGGGYFQHKIFYKKYAGGNIGQLTGEYLKGYDRLSNGYAFTFSFGYLNLTARKGLNAYIGLEYTQGVTQSRRLDFDTGLRNTTRRKDGMFGVRIAWVLPFLERNETEEFYY